MTRHCSTSPGRAGLASTAAAAAARPDGPGRPAGFTDGARCGFAKTRRQAPMANRLSQIATRTGDDGTTGLGDGSRVPKDHLRVQAMGDVDELNSQIGVLLAEPLPE
eukprot:Opistho-1_new@57020